MSEVESLSMGIDETMQPKKYVVPIQLNDMSIFDGAFTFMKERFSEEMRRVDDEMSLFSKNLHQLYNEAKTYHAVLWDSISNSPLVEGEGSNKTLRLQFDVSQFEPGEVNVTIFDNTLVVTAQHEEKSEGNVIHNQYHREFRLPYELNPECVKSVLSKDGILTVLAPLKLSLQFAIEDDVSM